VTASDEDQVEIAAWEQEPADLADQVRRAPGVPTIVFVAVPEGKFGEPRSDGWRSVRAERHDCGRLRPLRTFVVGEVPDNVTEPLPLSPRFLRASAGL
jgi:hypothetical protein